MSLTNMALSIGAKVIGHDDIKVGAELHDGIRSTNERGTVIVPPSIHGDGRTGPIVNDVHGNVVTDPDYDEEPAQEAVQAAKSRARKKRQTQQDQPSQPRSEAVKVVAHMEGFGTVKTAYTAFDPGDTCLRIELGELSWEPPRAERQDDGSFTGVFSFDEVPGRRYIYVGQRFTHDGRISLVLVEVP